MLIFKASAVDEWMHYPLSGTYAPLVHFNSSIARIAA